MRTLILGCLVALPFGSACTDTPQPTLADTDLTIHKGGLEPSVVGIWIVPPAYDGWPNITAIDPSDCFVLPSGTTATINGAPMVVTTLGEFAEVDGQKMCKGPLFGLGGSPDNLSGNIDTDEIIVTDGITTRRMTTTMDIFDVETEKVTVCEFSTCMFDLGW